MNGPTYESTLEHYGLTDTQLKVKCSEYVLRKLASKLDRWREIAIHLKLEKGVTDSVDGEHLNEEGKRYRLLERWTQILGHKATYERLVRCLLEATRADLADIVCEAIDQLPSVAEASTIQGGSVNIKTDPITGMALSNVQPEVTENAPVSDNHIEEETSTLRARHRNTLKDSTMEQSNGAHSSQMFAHHSSETNSTNYSSQVVDDHSSIQCAFYLLREYESLEQKVTDHIIKCQEKEANDLKIQLEEVKNFQRQLKTFCVIIIFLLVLLVIVASLALYIILGILQ